jgi:hypothetical protein
VLRALSLFQSSSIPQASAIAQKASEASKKTLNSSYSFLRRLPFFSRLQCGRWGCLLFLVWPFLLGYFWPSFRLLLAFFRGISGPSFRDFFSPFYGIYSAPFWQFWPFGSWIHLASFSLLFSNFYGPPRSWISDYCSQTLYFIKLLALLCPFVSRGFHDEFGCSRPLSDGCSSSIISPVQVYIFGRGTYLRQVL